MATYPQVYDYITGTEVRLCLDTGISPNLGQPLHSNGRYL